MVTRFTVVIVFLVLTIASVSVAFNIKQSNQLQNQNRVAKVVDGDTFELASGKRVRLLGVDAPEFDRCGGSEAKQHLSDYILGGEVVLSEQVSERYGRTLAIVKKGGVLINGIMIADGWGRPDYRKSSVRDLLTEAYHDAQKEKLGIWNQCISMEPVNEKCVIKGNIDTATYQKTYHLPACPQYKQVILNLAYGDNWFCSEKEAKNAGFEKAERCP